MMQGSDINLEISKIICTIYQIPWTRFIHINYFASTNNQSKQFSDELDTIDSSQDKLILLTEMKFTLYQKLVITVLFKRAQPEILGKKILLKNRGTLANY